MLVCFLSLVVRNFGEWLENRAIICNSFKGLLGTE